MKVECDKCGKDCYKSPSVYKRYSRHFCSVKCRQAYQAYMRDHK